MADSEGDEIGFLAHFARLEDPRQAAKTLYPLDETLLVSLCGVICGADSWVEVSTFGKMKLEFLRRFLPFKDGVPSHDTFGDVFAALDPEAFQACFVAWTASLARHIAGVVAIDGKTLRRSFDRVNGQAAIHMVSAWSSSQHLVLGQEKVAEKSNEITSYSQAARPAVAQGRHRHHRRHRLPDGHRPEDCRQGRRLRAGPEGQSGDPAPRH
jgi:hypothetical protein